MDYGIGYGMVCGIRQVPIQKVRTATIVAYNPRTGLSYRMRPNQYDKPGWLADWRTQTVTIKRRVINKMLEEVMAKKTDELEFRIDKHLVSLVCRSYQDGLCDLWVG